MTDLIAKAKAMEAKYRKQIPEAEQRPRHYAQEIIALKTREERRARLEQVPELYRSWVEEYVKDYFMKKKHDPKP